MEMSLSMNGQPPGSDPRKEEPRPDTGAGHPQAQPGQPVPQIHHTRLLAVLTATLFTTYTSILMLAPLLVELAAEFDTSIAAVGQLTAVTALPWAILAPYMGVLSDRFGRRPVLALGTALLGAAVLLSALSWNYTSMMVFRLIGGIGGATSGPNVMSAAADYFPASRRGRALGTVIAGLSLATVAGIPLVAFVAAHAGWRWSFVGVGAGLLLTATLVWLVMPRVRIRSTTTSALSGFRLALAERSSPLLLLANTLERTSFTAITTYLAAFLILSYGLALDAVAPILSLIAAGTLAGSLIGGRLADRGRQALTYSLLQVIAAAIALPVFFLAAGVGPTALLAAAFGVVGSLARPSWLWLITRVPESKRGTTTGFMATSNQAGLVAGASLGGVMVALGSYGYVGVLASVAAVLAAATCYLAAAR
jgi:MFS transporter, DHA1 family, inner membrane transport protein